jgi:putative flavoprotein involved in K+ transport
MSTYSTHSNSQSTRSSGDDGASVGAQAGSRPDDTTVGGRTHVENLVIGGGQAGLSTAYHLTRQGRECLVLDSGRRVGDNWRRHWDSLRLYSPARADGLPGMPFPGDPWHFPGKDEVGDYLEAYAAELALPVRCGVRVERLSREGEVFVAETGGETLTADNVVVATGTFGRTPSVPDFAGDLSSGIVQLHSSEYHRPGELAEGPVLVVGASHSGFDIAHEVATTHETVLVGPNRGQLPIRPEDPAFHVLFPLLWFVWGHVLSVRTPLGRKKRTAARAHGAPALRVKASDLVKDGVERVEERVVGVTEGRPRLEGGRVLDVANVIWATGFRQQFDWIDLPVVGEDGWPTEERGAVPTEPGLYFTGLCYQSSFRSMLIGGAGADAEAVVRRLLSRSRTRVAA